ncbi:hypothetical protein [Actinoplanes sp. GCM10030250]|uniref:hypothetical protein n=1 Tax=Actinoplanes sp. GCM10030250 TaxID=3273376 RepID=UPI00361809C0
MLGRLFRRDRPAPMPLDRDLAQDDLELRGARDRALAGDWSAVRSLLAAPPSWEVQVRRVVVLGDAASGDGAWLRNWLTEFPEDAAAWAIEAERLSAAAGKARGSRSADRTSEDQFQGFAGYSASAAQAARRAIELAPDAPGPWNTLLGTMLSGFPGVQAEFATAYAEGLRRDPHNFDLHLSATTFYCEKWHGTHEQMFTVARTAAANAPAGSTAAMLPVFAHFQFLLREHIWGSESVEDFNRRFVLCQEYMKTPTVLREVDDCVAKWRAGGAQKLGRTMTCRHWQALAYYLSDRDRLARPVHDEIGPYLGSTPAWAHFGGEERTFQIARLCAQRAK